MTDAAKIAYVKSYLRRTATLLQLRAIADQVFACATETVTLTANSFEGGASSGQVTFEKALLGTAVEELIREMDPAVAAAEGPPDRYLDFSWQRVQT